MTLKVNSEKTVYYDDSDDETNATEESRSKSNVRRDFQGLFDMSLFPVDLVSPSLDDAKKTFSDGFSSYNTLNKGTEQKLNSLEATVSTMQIAFTPFDFTSSSPVITQGEEEVEERKTALARCMRPAFSTTLDDYSSGSSYAALGVSACLKEHSRGLNEEEKRKLEEFVPNAVIGSQITAIAAPIAAISKIFRYIADIFIQGAVLQGAVESAPLRWTETYPKAIKCINDPSPELINEFVKDAPQWILNLGSTMAEFDASVRRFDQEMVEEYRPEPGILHGAVDGSIDLALIVLLGPAGKGAKTALKGTKDLISNAVKTTQVTWRSQNLIRRDAGATFVPLSSALRRIYRISGETKRTFVTDIKEVEKAIGKLPESANCKIISMKEAQELEQRLGLLPGAVLDGGTLSIIQNISMRKPTFPTKGNQFFTGKGLPKGGPELQISPIRNTGGGGIRQFDIIVNKTEAQKKEGAVRLLKDLKSQNPPEMQFFAPKDIDPKWMVECEWNSLYRVLEDSKEKLNKIIPPTRYCEERVIQQIDPAIDVSQCHHYNSQPGVSVTRYGTEKQAMVVKSSNDFGEAVFEAIGSEMLRSLDLQHLHIPSVKHLSYDGCEYVMFRDYAPGKNVAELLGDIPKYNSSERKYKEYVNSMSQTMCQLGESQKELATKSLKYRASPCDIEIDMVTDGLEDFLSQAQEISSYFTGGLDQLKEKHINPIIQKFTNSPGYGSFKVGDPGLNNFIYSLKEKKLSYIDGTGILLSFDRAKRPTGIIGRDMSAIICDIYELPISKGVDFDIAHGLATKFLEGYELPIQRIHTLSGELDAICGIGCDLIRFRRIERGKETGRFLEKMDIIESNLKKLIDHVVSKYSG